MASGTVLITLIAGGFAGGLIHGICRPRSYEIVVPFTGRRMGLGFIGDLLIGAAASVVVYPVMALLTTSSSGPALDLLRVASLGLIAGYAGRPVLDRLSSHLAQRIGELGGKITEVQQDSKMLNYLRIADHCYESGSYDSAIYYYDEILRIDATNGEALLNKARALRRKGAIHAAYEICRSVVSQSPNDPRALYNLACYSHLLQLPVEEVYKYLEKAIAAFPLYREYARKDPDFDKLRQCAGFIRIVQA